MLYEVWEKDDEQDGVVEIACFPVDGNVEKKRKLEQPAKLLRTFEAASWEEAMSKHHELMGWESYVPNPDWVEET